MSTNDKNAEEWIRLHRIEEAYRKFSKILIAEAHTRFLNDQHMAEDVVQTTFERVLKYGHNFASYDNTVAFRFLYTIMRHEAYHVLEKQKKIFQTAEVEQILDEISNSTVNLNKNPEFLYVERTLIHEAIKKLPPKYSSILYLHYYHGYKFKEIANFLGISENTVIQRNYYIRQKLKGILVKEGFRDEKEQ